MKTLFKFLLRFIFGMGKEEEGGGDAAQCNIKTHPVGDGNFQISVDPTPEFIQYLRDNGYSGTDDDVIMRYLQAMLRQVVEDAHSDPNRYE